jgi:hypothetical protein
MDKELNELMVNMTSLNQIEFREKMTQFAEDLANHEDSIVRESYKQNDAIDTINNNKLEHFFWRRYVYKKNNYA